MQVNFSTDCTAYRRLRQTLLIFGKGRVFKFCSEDIGSLFFVRSTDRKYVTTDNARQQLRGCIKSTHMRGNHVVLEAPEKRDLALSQPCQYAAQCLIAVETSSIAHIAGTASPIYCTFYFWASVVVVVTTSGAGLRARYTELDESRGARNILLFNQTQI